MYQAEEEPSPWADKWGGGKSNDNPFSDERPLPSAYFKVEPTPESLYGHQPGAFTPTGSAESSNGSNHEPTATASHHVPTVLSTAGGIPAIPEAVTNNGTTEVNCQPGDY